MKIIEKAKNVVKRLWKLLRSPQMLVLPGQLAFFFLLAIVPTVTLIVTGATIFHVSYDFMSTFLVKAFGNDIKDLVLPIITEIKFTPEYFIPLFIAFFAASGGANSIIVTSNELYHCENKSYLRRYVKSFFMIFIFISLIIFLMLIPVFGDKFIELIKYMNNETVTSITTFLINLSKGPLSWFLMFFLIKIIFTLAPDTHIPSSLTTKGSLFTTIGFVITTRIYSFYINHFAHYDILYGGLAHFAVLMIWFYIISYVIVIGIAINAEEVARWKK